MRDGDAYKRRRGVLIVPYTAAVYDDGFLRHAGSKTPSFVFEQKPTGRLSFATHSRPQVRDNNNIITINFQGRGESVEKN